MNLSLLQPKPTFPTLLFPFIFSMLQSSWASTAPAAKDLPPPCLSSCFPHVPSAWTVFPTLTPLMHKSHPSFKSQIKCCFFPVTSSDCHLPTLTKSWKLSGASLNSKPFIYASLTFIAFSCMTMYVNIMSLQLIVSPNLICFCIYAVSTLIDALLVVSAHKFSVG